MAKGRITKDEKKDEFVIEKTYRLKKFRAPKKDQRHLDFISKNMTYSDEENLRLCDIFQEGILEMATFEELERALRNLPLATLNKFVGSDKEN